MPTLLETPFARFPRISALLFYLTILALLLSLHSHYTSLPGEFGTPDAPSLKRRLEMGDALWKESVELRHDLFAKFGPTPQPFPTGSPLPYYTLWNFFTPAFNCPWEMKRVGTFMDGGRWVCGLSRLREEKDCVVYSFGQLEESSFEAEILLRTKGCKVFGYDDRTKNFGPEVSDVAALRARSHFFPYVLGPKEKHTAHPPQWTLRGLMKAHGHTHIDILRIDVEGTEFTLLTDILTQFKDAGEELPIGQILVELHALRKETKWMVDWWETLEAAGLRAFMTEPNMVFANLARHDEPPGLAEYSFINVKGNSRLIN